MNYCSHCGAAVTVRIPAGDHLPRHVCTACGMIHYRNPKVVVGCLPEWQGQLLLCQRAIEPRRGYWTLPAGFLENGETAQAGAARETWEEAQARVAIGALQSLFNLPQLDQLYLLFHGRLLDARCAPGSESLAVAFFDEASLPWEALAFPVIETALRLYFADRRSGRVGLRCGDIWHDATAGYRVRLDED